MANWRKLAKELLLADGRIDQRETDIIRKELFADGVIDDQELEFLLDLKKGAQGVAVAYNVMLFEGVKKHILREGKIDSSDATWLKQWLFADGKIDPPEKKLLQDLKAEAKQVSREFEELYKRCMSS